MKHSEDAIQIELANWLRRRARIDARYHHCYHIPNGGNRSAREGAKFKLMGVVAGIPDLFIGIPNATFHGLYIELKTATGRVSKVQKEVHRIARGNGYAVAVCRSAAEAIETILNYEKDQYHE